MQNLFSRRDILLLLGLGTISLASTTLDRNSYAEARQRSVIIIGGGLAGLCCAYELRKRGMKVLAVLEAQGRTGGRVLTLRENTKDQQYIEMGATRIADTHAHTLAYAEEFCLPLKEISTKDAALYGLKGKFFTHKDGMPWPQFLDIQPQNRQLGADDLMMKYEHLENINNPQKINWPRGADSIYDEYTFREYLQHSGMTEDEISVIQANNGSEINRANALYWLMTEVMDAKWKKTYAILGGNDKLPSAFTQALGSLVKYRCIVTSIQQQTREVLVQFEQNRHTKTLAADVVICAIPFSTLRDIHVSPQWSEEKAQVVQTLRMMPVVRCAFQTQSRFWLNQNVGGLKVVRTDTALERIWDLSQVQEGQHGIITAYLQNQNALRVGKMKASQRLSWMKNRIATFWPEIHHQALGSWLKIWQADPWQKGAWSLYEAKEMNLMFPAAKRREGRIFFCGEHTSPWSGWMQGALESAHRVVADILG